MQRFVDSILAVTKESVKTITFEFLNNFVKLINGISAFLLTLLPGKSNILEGLHGWELRPTFRGPRFPRWMESGVSSFNELFHELSASSTPGASHPPGEDGDEGVHSTPCSSHSSSSQGYTSIGGDRWVAWMVSPLTQVIIILRCLISAVNRRCHGNYIKRRPRGPPCRGRFFLKLPSFDKIHSIKEHVVHRTTDRRRGVIEDLHLGTEIVIEVIFDFIHKSARFLLSPSDIFKSLHDLFTHHDGGHLVNDIHDHRSAGSVASSTLGEESPSLKQKKAPLRSMNTDSRTCRDVITELGYPYEAFRVVTSDGYILILERIPRHESSKVLYLQHGVFDSSMGWVSNGTVGSPAFAAYDQGFDVFLGNFRGLVSREHVDKHISSREYWSYSLNEHGVEDIPAIIGKIHELKTAELNSDPPETTGQPYKLCSISHSLGGAAMIMYIITRRLESRPHRLSRIILLSPAGFHDDSSLIFTFSEHLFLLFSPLLLRVVPAFYIPTRFFRMLLNKLARDFHIYPAVGGLVQTLVSYAFGGDTSNWVGALGLSHYNMNDMPGVSFRVAHHLSQMKRAGKFTMYDHGTPSGNTEAYGSPNPPDLGGSYAVIDIPVDLVAGRKDNVIRPSMVRKHYEVMKGNGVDVSYNEYEYAHLDFTFSHREELLAYVMSRLLLV